MPILGRYAHNRLSSHEDDIKANSVVASSEYYPVVYLGDEKIVDGVPVNNIVDNIYNTKYSAFASILNTRKPSLKVEQNAIFIHSKQNSVNFLLNEIDSVANHLKHTRLVTIVSSGIVHVYLCNNVRAATKVLEDCNALFEVCDGVASFKKSHHPNMIEVVHSTSSSSEKKINGQETCTNEVQNVEKSVDITDDGNNDDENNGEQRFNDFGDFQSVFTDSFHKTKSEGDKKINIYQKLDSDDGVTNNKPESSTPVESPGSERPRSSIFSHYTKLSNNDDLVKF